MIEFLNLSKSYENIGVLKNINLTFPANKVSVVMGESGCGKSTILKLILGLERPTKGSILIEGMQLSQQNEVALRRKTGFVMQEGGLFPHLTAYQNIMLLPSYLGRENQLKKRLEELCDLCKLGAGELDRYPKELSGGQKQRVSLIRALILDPTLILLDEPLSALDPMIRSSLQKDLQNIFSKLNKTVVMVSHDLAEASYLGQNIVLLKDGSIEQNSSFADFIENPQTDYVRSFVNAQRRLFV